MPMPFKTPTSIEELMELQRATTALLREHHLTVAKYKLTKGAKSDAQREVILSKYKSEQELLAAAGEISEATKKEYLKCGSSLFSRARELGRDVWLFAEERSGNKRSWYAAKAALQYFLAHQVRASKVAIDSWMRFRRAGADAQLLLGTQKSARDAFDITLTLFPEFANALASTPHGKLPAKFAGSGEGKSKSKSKSRSVLRRPSDWREQVARKLSPTYRLLYCIQCVSGCRPVELHGENGVTVVLRAEGTLEVTTSGAKLGLHAGQERRQVVVPAHTGIAKMLAGMLEVDSPTFAAELLPSTVNAYREAVNRAGRSAFPRDKAVRRLTTYSARHQFTADLRAADLSREEVGKAMGHATTRSASYYGSGVRAGKGAVAPTAVQASRPVKERGRHPNNKAKKQAVSATTRASRVRKTKP